MPHHRDIDARSLAFGHAIAARLRTHPELLQTARENLNRWRTTATTRSSSALDEWESALNGPLESVLALLTGTDEHATRLRQSNPFAGTLSEQDRNTILMQFQKQ